MKQIRVMKAQFIFEIGFPCTESLKNCSKDEESKFIISVDFNFTAYESFDISHIESSILDRMNLLVNNNDFYVTRIENLKVITKSDRVLIALLPKQPIGTKQEHRLQLSSLYGNKFILNISISNLHLI